MSRRRSRVSAEEIPFWKRKSLAQMSDSEWESLCDGCGRCCLVKLEDEDTGQLHFTDVRCRLLDGEACRCRSYGERSELVSDCVRLTPRLVAELPWLPPSCAYRLVHEGKDLGWWHPLVSGDPETVHLSGMSARGRTRLDEDQVGPDDWHLHIVGWPTRWSKAARRGP
jgi:uncharacterized cysteine cluster protein YcgN (CxxCxxCC family)